MILGAIRSYRTKRYIDRLTERGLILGNNVFLNDGFFLDPAHCHLIEIGDNVVFGPRVMIFAHDASAKKAIGKTVVSAVRIGRNAFIGAGTIILPGSTVGEGSIVGSGSVLKASVGAFELWAGNPARKLCTIEEYIERLKSRPGPDFNESEFSASNLNSDRRRQMREALRDGAVGYMVAE
jgi:maltose O-acetyltransferase